MQEFLNTGIFTYNYKLDIKNITYLLNQIKDTRQFGPGLFIDEKDFNGIHAKTNPGQGYNNLLEERGYIKSGKIGSATVKLMNANEIFIEAQKLLKENPFLFHKISK